MSTKEIVYQLPQNLPDQIAALIPSCYRVLHVEQVLRADLAQNLLLFQASLRHTLSAQRLDAYCPATGSKFVVEEVGEVSEDEEEYGDYQALRAEGASEKESNTEFWSWIKVAGEEKERLKEGSHEAEEYIDHRNTSRVPHGFGKMGRSAQAWDDLSLAGDELADKDDGQEFVLALMMTDNAQD